MKIYIAGPLFYEKAKTILEKIDKLCKELNFETFLPHRDVGLYQKGDSKPFFKKDRDMIDWCNLMVAYLDWKGISSGTAWEIGYAYARKIPIIALVEDKKSIVQSDRLCVMCFNSADVVETLEELKEKLKKYKSSV